MADEGAMRSLFPTWYLAPLPPAAVIQWVVLNWLAKEVPAPAELIAALAMLSGWRNREVYEYVKAHDYTIAMFDGQPVSLPERDYWDKFNRHG